MKRSILFFLGLAFYLGAGAQIVSISGSVINEDEKTPVSNAVISLITPKDSIIYKFTRTDASGKFSLKDVDPGKYILMASQPYFGDLLDNIDIGKDTKIPDIELIPKSKLLQAVIIKAGPMRIKGDTTIYTADSFKVSANANVGELLKKMPGIQVDKDGKITAMGETVQKVLVDGEEFFGDDPGMAVKNLRADAVKEVQVFDKKSDQAEFTGIDDGNTKKTINLKLKDNAKKGYFGKIDVTGGPQKDIENRYNTNLLLSSFKGKRKLSGFLLNGNTGQDGLSWQDEQKYGGNSDVNVTMDDDGGIMMMWTGGGDDEPYVDTRNGFTTNTNAGLVYSNKWKDKYNFNITPKYNQQDYTNHVNSLTRTFIGDSILNNRSNETNNVNRYNLKFKGVLDIKLDSMNSLKITANSNFYHTEGSNQLKSQTTGENEVLKNTSNRNTQTENDKSAQSGNIIFKHKFRKNRRTLTASTDWNLLTTKGVSYLKSENLTYQDGNIANSQFIDQLKEADQNTKNLAASLTYTEPLSKEYSLELGYRLAYNYGTNNQLVNTITPATGKYEEKVDSLSNQFNQNIVQNIPSAKINFSNKKLKANIGAGFGFTNFELKDVTLDKDYNRDYVNFYPNATATYTYKPNKNIRFRYNGNTNQPSINQLQPLRNNDNIFNQYIGNPDLKPSFTSNFNLSHNSYNFLKDFYNYQSINLRLTENSISNNQVINLQTGKTITQPVNLKNGGYYFNFYSGIGFKIKKADLRVSFGPQLSLSENPGIINNITRTSRAITPGFSTSLSKEKEKKYSFSLYNRFGYTSNSTQFPGKNTNINYLTNNLQFYATLYYKKVWSLNSDYQFDYRQKTFQGDKDLSFHILNARLQRTFKNDEFTAYFMVNDILNQNVGINRNYYNSTYSEVINDRLKRYFMIGFSWDFKNRGAKTK